MGTSEKPLLERIQELILDEDKIVTATTLSMTLNINIRETENLLSEFINSHRKSNPDELAVTYVLSGTLKDGRLAIILVEERELNTRKQLFDVVSHETIFSVQKRKEIDFDIISLVDKFDSSTIQENPIRGSIVSKNCVKRELKVVKPVIHEEPKKEVVKKKLSLSNNPSESSKSSTTADVKPVERKPVENKKPTQTKIHSKPRTSRISNFFTKTDKNAVKDEPISKPTTVLQEENIEKVTMKEEIVVEIATSGEGSEPEVVEKPPKKDNTPKTPKRNDTSKRQRSTGKRSDKNTKRRKRIVERNDSDSDDMFGDANEEETETNGTKHSRQISSDEEPEFINKETAPPPQKNKRRKLVDKTFEDEDGYILTTKEWVYESASDGENEEEKVAETKEKAKPKEPLKAKEENMKTQTKREREASPVKVGNGKGGKKLKKAVSGNQPTLMSFFKKA